MFLLLFVAIAVFFFKTYKAWFHIGIVMGIAILFSLILTPACNRLENLGIGTAVSGLIAVGGFVLILFIFLFSFVPFLIIHAMSLVGRISPTITMVLEYTEKILAKWGERIVPEFNIAQLISSAMAPMTAGIARSSVAFVSAAGNVMMAIVIAYYLLTVRQTAVRHLMMLIPTSYRRAFIAAAKGSRIAVLGYLSGLMKTSLFVGGATFLSLVLLGVREAAILSIFMGVLECFPYVGPVLGSLPILLSVLPMGLGKTMIAFVLIILIQQLESSIIGPYFTASSTSIHPLAAIISVYIGGSLFGLAGILLAIPFVVIGRSVNWTIRSMSIQTDS